MLPNRQKIWAHTSQKAADEKIGQLPEKPVKYDFQYKDSVLCLFRYAFLIASLPINPQNGSFNLLLKVSKYRRYPTFFPYSLSACL